MNVLLASTKYSWNSHKSLFDMPLKLLVMKFWGIVRLSLLTVRKWIMHVNSTDVTSVGRSNFMFLNIACMDVSNCYILACMTFVTSTLLYLLPFLKRQNGYPVYLKLTNVLFSRLIN